MDVRAMNHRIRIAEALAECRADLEGRHFLAVDRIHHDQAFGEHCAAARIFTDPQRIHRGEGVRRQLDAGADLADLGALFQQGDPYTLARQGQRGCHAANAATYYDDR
jgi:hypothetical protein